MNERVESNTQKRNKITYDKVTANSEKKKEQRRKLLPLDIKLLLMLC